MPSNSPLDTDQPAEIVLSNTDIAEMFRGEPWPLKNRDGKRIGWIRSARFDGEYTYAAVEYEER